MSTDYRYEIKFVLDNWKNELNKSNITVLDSKTKLQEYSLKHFQKLPIYKVLSSKGPRHNPSYKVSVKINDTKYFYGIGNSKKISEHVAAKNLLKSLKIN